MCFPASLFLVNKYDIKLPKRDELRPFRPSDVSCKSVDGVIEGTAYTSNIGFISLFIERGQYTKFPYQLVMNHRDIDLSILHSGTNGKRPMLLSMVDPKEGAEKFDASTMVSLFFHGVEDTSAKYGTDESDEDGLAGGAVSRKILDKPGEDKKELLRTQCFVKAKGEDGQTVNGYGYIRDREAVVLEIKPFQRLLAIFGYRWVDDDGEEVLIEEVTPSVLLSFLRLFDDYELFTEEGFQKFLEDFTMEKYYRFQEGVDLATQYRQFGAFLRSITSVRVGTYDGQHRMFLMMHYFTGCFDITDRCPLETAAWTDSKHCDTFDDWQLWQKLQFAVGGPQIPTSMPMILDYLRARGKELTESQKYYIPVDTFAIVKKMAVEFHGLLAGGSELTPLTFDTYWKKGSKKRATEDNLLNSFCHLQQYMQQEAKIMIDAVILKKDSMTPAMWEKQIATCKGRYVDMQKWAAWPINKSKVNDMARELGHPLLLLKLAASTQGTLMALNSFFGVQSPRHDQQRPSDAIAVSRYHSINWIKTFILDNLWFIVECYALNRLLLEQHIVKLIRDDDKYLQKEYYYGAYEWKSFGDEDLESKERVKNGGLLRAKIQYAIAVKLFEEIFNCIDEFGLDPQLGSDPDVNTSLKAYTR